MSEISAILSSHLNIRLFFVLWFHLQERFPFTRSRLGQEPSCCSRLLFISQTLLQVAARQLKVLKELEKGSFLVALAAIFGLLLSWNSVIPVASYTMSQMRRQPSVEALPLPLYLIRCSALSAFFFSDVYPAIFRGETVIKRWTKWRLRSYSIH